MSARLCVVCSASMLGRHASAVVCSDDCRKVRQRTHRSSWGKRNREKLTAANRAYCARNRDRYAEYQYLRRYGLSFSDVSSMWSAQGGACAICATPLRLRGPKGRDKVVVDHCHATNKVRGLLCTPCNLLIGYANDNPSTLGSAIAYLRGRA